LTQASPKELLFIQAKHNPKRLPESMLWKVLDLYSGDVRSNTRVVYTIKERIKFAKLFRELIKKQK